jgi:NAD+ kinase
MMPIDLVLVRHGQSEGNAAKRRSEAGDHTAFTQDFLNRHTSSFRLTERGREQARLTGDYLRRTFYDRGVVFDRCVTSEYVRAMETAALLSLPNAEWYRDVYLTERDWGALDSCPENEREEKFGTELQRRQVQPFFWRPPNGESFLQLCMRVDRVLDTLHRECSDKRVIVVCHGEVIRAFQMRLERLSQERFKELTFTQHHELRIHNCQIVHYSRRHPTTERLESNANWKQAVRPSDVPLWQTSWERIVRPRFSNMQLQEEAEQVVPMVL